VNGGWGSLAGERASMLLSGLLRTDSYCSVYFWSVQQLKLQRFSDRTVTF
jgi:hypothetical protein